MENDSRATTRGDQAEGNKESKTHSCNFATFVSKQIFNETAAVERMNAEFDVFELVIHEIIGKVETESNDEVVVKAKQYLADAKKTKLLSSQTNKSCQQQLEMMNLFERSLSEKQKMLESKRLFLSYMMSLKEKESAVLQSVFNELNQVEDDYCVIEQGILNLKRASEQNSEERNNFQAT